jgi:hypothetical protein
MKITKRQLRRIIKEEKVKLLAEQSHYSTPLGNSPSTDTLILVDYLGEAALEFLEEMGASAEEAFTIINDLRSPGNAEFLNIALANALRDYKKKLGT